MLLFKHHIIRILREEDSNGGDDGEGGEGYQTKPVKKISYTLLGSIL